MKKPTQVFVPLLATLLMVTSCGTSNQSEAGAASEPEQEIDREIDVWLEGYDRIGGMIHMTELDLDGNPMESAYGGIGILAAEEETIGSALDHAGYSDLQPVLEGDVFEGWMEVVEEVVLDEYDFEETVRKVLPEKIYTTEELLALTVPAQGVTYVAKWESVPAESYFEPVDAWETDDVFTVGSFSFSANGGLMSFHHADGSGSQWPEYAYWLEDGQALNEIMGTDNGAALIGVEKEDAEFLGWTLYEAESVFLGDEPFEAEGILCFMYDSEDSGYCTVLKNPVLIGEQMSTEQLCAMSVTGTNYFAVAEWSESEI